MKKLLVIALLLCSSAQATHMVNGYYRSNGTYVSPHMSSDPYESSSTGMSYSDGIYGSAY